MSPVAAQECPGSNSPCSPPKQPTAPATAMVSRSPPPSIRLLFTAMLENRLEIPPLNAERFNGSFNHFCSVKGLRVALDLEPPHVGEKEVDFHSLHQEVMNNRGYNANERRQDFWLKISQNLDLIHESPGMSPASAEVANRLATIYGQYLQQFDEIYVRSFVQELQHWGRHSTSIG